MEQYTHEGMVFDVTDSGPPDGPVVVLLHGFPQRATSWRAVSERLHREGLRTVAPDQRGYSPGARPKGRRPYTLEHLVGDACALIDTLDAGPVHLVGHDWGAAVAWGTAAAHPDRVATLTTVSVPHPRAFLGSMVRSRQLLQSWYMALFNVPGLVERIAERDPRRLLTALAKGGMTPEMVATVRREILDDGALPGGLAWYRAVPLTRPGRAPGKVRVPTTHVWSDGDVALGRRGAELTGQWVDAPYRLAVLTGVSHWIPDEAPDELARLVVERIREGER